MKALIICLTVFSTLLAVNVLAQSEKPLVRKGNKLYEKGIFSDAETQYRKSLEKNKSSFEGSFNLGDALYKQKKYDEASAQFHNNTQSVKDKAKLADTWYNLGNSQLKNEKYAESVESYKNALKNNPVDEDARYNLSYALAKLRHQQQQQQQKDKKNKEQQKDKQENKEQQKQEEQKQDQKQEQQAQQKEQKISKENAERILEALKNDEKDLQKKYAKKEAVRSKAAKQW